MAFDKKIHLSLDDFIAYVGKDLEKCILNCAQSIISTLRSHYDPALIKHIPQGLPKNKIMNFDIIDYFKYNIINNEILQQKYTLDPCGWLYITEGFDTTYTRPSINEFIRLFTPYRAKIHEVVSNTYRAINNKIIADYFAKLNDTHDLLDNDDKIGDTIQLNSSADVDAGLREQLFVFINNEWLVANDDAAYHSDLIADYLAKITNNRDYYNLCGEKLYTVNDIYLEEPEEEPEEIVKQIELKPLFFGSIQGEIGYLNSAKNINKKTAAEMIKQKFNVKKVYLQNQQQYKYVRLAKKL